jgi:hypothetical protein
MMSNKMRANHRVKQWFVREFESASAWVDLYYEDFVMNPTKGIATLCSALGITCDEMYYHTVQDIFKRFTISHSYPRIEWLKVNALSSLAIIMSILRPLVSWNTSSV